MKLILTVLATAILGGLVLAFPAFADHDTQQRIRMTIAPADTSNAAPQPEMPRRVVSRVVGSAFLLNRDGTVFTGE
jgi:hypothetical protein